MSSGIITKEYTVWCGYCPDWHQDAMVLNAKEMEKSIRRGKWRKKNGLFICPNCQRLRKTEVRDQ